MFSSWRRSVLVQLVVLAIAGPAFAGDAQDTATDRPIPDATWVESCAPACNLEPLWRVSADAIFLHPSKPRAAVLVTDQFTPGGNVLLDANEFGFGYDLGFATDVIRNRILGTEWGAEMRYFAVNDWNASVATVNSPNGAVVQFVNGLGNTDFPADLSATYQSSLRSLEVTARRPVTGCVTLLAGFRYVEFSERGLSIFQDVLDDPVNHAVYEINARNSLAGFQAGVDAHLWSYNRLVIDGAFKAGIYSNRASSSVTITDEIGGNFASAARKTSNAFVGEMDFTSTYNLTEHWALRGGYQLLWLSGIARASDQVAVSDPFNGVGAVDTNGHLFCHGAFLGVEFHH